MVQQLLPTTPQPPLQLPILLLGSLSTKGSVLTSDESAWTILRLVQTTTATNRQKRLCKTPGPASTSVRKLDPTGELLAPIITPRFAPSCLTDTLTELGKLANEEDLRIQTHISENVNELKLVESLFPMHNSYAEVYDHHSLLTPRTILAHAVHLTSDERALVKKRNSKISHCPASNSALGSGFCPVRTMLDEGIDVGLGTDVSGGYSPSILETVRQACLVSRHVGFVNGGDSRYNLGVAEGLHLATVGGAKVVGMQNKLGAFEDGMLWDAQEIQLNKVNDEGEGGDSGVDIFGWESWEDRIAKWVWNGDDRNVKRVWVGGRLVHERK